MQSICTFLDIYHILTVLLGLDSYSESIGYIPEPEIARRCINFSALIAIFGRHIYAVQNNYSTDKLY